MFTLDPEVGAGLAAIMGPTPPPKAPVGDVAGRRAALAGLFSALAANFPRITDVESKDFFTKASDGHTILCRWYTKIPSPNSPTPTTPGPAILYVHGGGMIALSIENYAAAIQTYVSTTSIPFLLVEYRLSPEVTSPTPVTDSFTALQFLHSHASELSIDPSRIAIMGDSAGGGIAASLAHYTKSLPNGPKISKQILIYPMLDDRNTTEDPLLAPFATWSNDDNITGWTALLTPSRIGGKDISVIEAAGRMTISEAKDLPAAYIEVGELDIFRQEDLEYAKTLGEAGVSVEFHLYPRVNHAFEAFAPESAIAKMAMGNRIRAVLSV